VTKATKVQSNRNSLALISIVSPFTTRHPEDILKIYLRERAERARENTSGGGRGRGKEGSLMSGSIPGPWDHYPKADA